MVYIESVESKLLERRIAAACWKSGGGHLERGSRPEPVALEESSKKTAIEKGEFQMTDDQVTDDSLFGESAGPNPAQLRQAKPRQLNQNPVRKSRTTKKPLVARTHKRTTTSVSPVINTGRRANGTFAPGHPYSWQPGQPSPNPAGRPRAPRCISELYRERLAEVNPSDQQGRTNGQIIADVVLVSALKGNFKAISEMTDRTEGRPKQSAGFQPFNPMVWDEWIEIRDIFADTLERFPEAKAAVLEALDRHDQDANQDTDNPLKIEYKQHSMTG
jgi:hypothetical protein